MYRADGGVGGSKWWCIDAPNLAPGASEVAGADMPASLRVTSSTLSPLQHTATRCNTLQHAATHCNALQRAVYHDSSTHCAGVVSYTPASLW